MTDVEAVRLLIEPHMPGRVAVLWAADLAEMYTRYSQNKKWPATYWCGPGTVNFSIAINDPEAWRLLQWETGIHRTLVFDQIKQQRVTAFAKVTAYPIIDGTAHLAHEAGSQVRTYVRWPYTEVRDQFSEVRSDNVDAVLNGDLDWILEAIAERIEQARYRSNSGTLTKGN